MASLYNTTYDCKRPRSRVFVRSITGGLAYKVMISILSNSNGDRYLADVRRWDYGQTGRVLNDSVHRYADAQHPFSACMSPAGIFPCMRQWESRRPCGRLAELPGPDRASAVCDIVNECMRFPAVYFRHRSSSQ